MLYHMPVSFSSDPLQSITDFHVSSCPKEYLASLLIAIGVVQDSDRVGGLDGWKKVGESLYSNK